jgi:hypothetical protein
VGVVEVERVARDTVDQRGPGGVSGPISADHGAVAGGYFLHDDRRHRLLATRECAPEPIHEAVDADLDHLGRKVVEANCRPTLGESLDESAGG